MPRTQYQQDVYPLAAGQLGHIEGLTLSRQTDSDNKQPLIHYFGGLPYALPPIGPYRFRRPRPLPESYRYGTKANPGRFTGGTAYCPQPRRFIDLDTSLWDEDCLQLNIYIPAGRRAPINGWPVFFYIHGGFLQWGTADELPRAIAPLLSETAFEAIIVMPAYRLNLFGFLASKELEAEAKTNGETAGNMGFWDQRAALEWTAKNIGFFGGDASKVTVGGYSAGAHSAFHQLAHELLFVPDDKAIIKRTISWSNSPGVQPRTVPQHQKQFEELLGSLDISLSLSAEEKLEKLRATSVQDLVEVQEKLKISEFRATSDDAFVSKQLMASINSGDFARRMKARGIKFMNGECRDEHNLYQSWRTPSNSYDAVRTRLVGDYPETVVDKLMFHYCGKAKKLPPGVKDWPEIFGLIYADMQVHSLERGLHRALSKGGLVYGKDVFRYRFEWRAKCVDSNFPPEWGVTHATDMAIWFWGLDYGSGLSEEDQKIVSPFNEAFAAFVKGEDLRWDTSNVKEMKRLRSDGKTDIWIDNQWEEGLKVWDLVNGSDASGVLGWIRAKL
ncbi:hypothetical protein LTR37_004443 [Vermiconidia calcicola]|uniref:Uncharacterized protein n=1 Tax=Vermiconidia calcicola TaxID=1690605 RepID=A0ACC3NNH7_9PEZI|nr:hypothetical protein LTR37_004443 [Vermiconidia calcicola]